MKVLVATTIGQGQRRNDFAHAETGELVYIGFECDGEAVDGACGCRRGWTGFGSGKGTTTARIVELPLTAHAYRSQLRKALADHLAFDLSEDSTEPVDELEAIVDNHLAELQRLAGMDDTLLTPFWPVGTVLERRGTTIRGRAILATTEVTA